MVGVLGVEGGAVAVSRDSKGASDHWARRSRLKVPSLHTINDLTGTILALGAQRTKPTWLIGLVCTSLCEDRQTDMGLGHMHTVVHMRLETAVRVEGSPAVPWSQDTSQGQGLQARRQAWSGSPRIAIGLGPSEQCSLHWPCSTSPLGFLQCEMQRAPDWDSWGFI